MTARDDLAADLIAADETYGQRARPPWDEIADHLIDQGWSRPRVVTTQRELSGLPQGTRILHEESGLIYVRTNCPRSETTWEWRILQPGRAQWLFTSELAGLPYVVLWSPPAETDGQPAPAPFDLGAHIHRARAFSAKTFGPGARSKGVVAHIRKELAEIEADPTDLMEWVDVMILAIDGAWRAGHEPEAIVAALVAKQDRNEARVWPDWRTASEDQPIEHDRTVPESVGPAGGQ